MSISEPSIRRPVMTTLVMAAIVLAGLLGYRLLPVAELPSVDFPTINVSANLPGASPETMAAAVATPLEAQFSTIAGLDSMTSVSAQGITQITLQFVLERSIDAAAQDVQTAIATALRLLPANMPTPPSFRKVNPADAPVFYVSMRSLTMPLSQLDEYAETQLAQRLSTISGVAQVQVFGSKKYAVRVQVDPAKLAMRGVTINDVQAALQNGNSNLATGQIDTAAQTLSINSSGQLSNAAGYEKLIVDSRNGNPMRVGDVGRAIDSVENVRNGAWFKGTPTIILAIQRQPGSNTIEVVDAIKRVLPAFRATLPGRVEMSVMYDRSESIRASVRDVQFTLLLSSSLVVLVIFLFLKNGRATLIPAITLPISLIGTFAVMAFAGFSIDNLSLLALTLAVGYVVDDAIVMLENIFRHVERGESAWQAALAGSREIGFTIVSMTLALIAVFIPLLFMPGVVGRLFHEFAVTICASVLVSAVVALTLTPMMCARVLKGGEEHAAPRWLAWFDWLLERTRRGYARTLAWTVRHDVWMLAVFAATLVLSAALFVTIPKDFLPSGDSGQLIGFVEGPVDASFEYMAAQRTKIDAVVRQDPDVEAWGIFMGVSGSRTTSNTGNVFIRLKDLSERHASAEQIAARLRPKFSTLTGVRIYLQNPPTIRLGGAITSALYQYVLQSLDLPELYRFTDLMLARLRATPGFVDVGTNLNLNSPSLQVTMDRDKLESLGLTASQVENTLGNAFGTRQVSTIYGSANQYQVILEALPQMQRDPRALSQLQLRTPGGKLVPLDAVATITSSTQALTVNHLGQLPAVTIIFNLDPSLPIGNAVTQLRRIEHDLDISASITPSLQGNAAAFAQTQQGLVGLLIIAIIVVYVILGILYESFIHPLTILSGLPTAGVGALLALQLTGTPLGVYGLRWVDPAGWYRQEKRNHDGRLRRGRAPRGRESPRGDSQRGGDPVSADHDDHAGGARGRHADRARFGRGRRGAAAAWHRGGRRLACVAGVDALHHAGGVRRVGPLRAKRARKRAAGVSPAGRTAAPSCITRAAAGRGAGGVRSARNQDPSARLAGR